MRRFLLVSAALLLPVIVPAAHGQARPGMPVTNPTQMAPLAPGFGNPYASVTVIVADENGADLGQQALVKLYSNLTSSNVWGTTQDRSQIIFDQVPLADYEVEVSAAGFDTTTKDLSVMTAQAYELIVRLKRDDSGAVTNPVPGQLLAPKARREVQKGLAALNTQNLKEAQKHFEAAYALAPANADVDYLLGFLYMQKKDATQAETYLEKAISIDPHHVRSLMAIGQLRIQEKDYPRAVKALEQVVAVDAGAWMGHWLLAEAYLRVSDFDKAVEQSDLALEKGKAAAVRVEVVKGEALASMGNRQGAIAAFEQFIKKSPGDPMFVPVVEMITQLKERPGKPAFEAASATPAPTMMPASLNPPIMTPSDNGGASSKVTVPLWRPPSVDDEKPVLASGAVCPAQRVIDGASKRAHELVESVSKIDALEGVLHEELDEFGSPIVKETRKFDYIVSISELRRQGLAIDEYRTSLTDRADFPGDIDTRGLHGLAMVFHPLLRDDYQMTCEGLGQWKGKATWLVYFRQRPDRPSRLMGYEFTDGEFAVPLKGRAWIAADTFEIVHLEADLMKPLPDIQLRSQHQAVDYGLVHFAAKNTDLWLPTSAELFFDFRHHRYYRKHTFADYKLFSVGASEKIGAPKDPAESKDSGEKPQN